MTYYEAFVCTSCGHRGEREINASGDYDSPNEAVKVERCAVCKSPAYQKLRHEYEQLLARLK